MSSSPGRAVGGPASVPAVLAAGALGVLLLCPGRALASCPSLLPLANDVVSSLVTESACGPINIGPNYTVASGGVLRLQSTSGVAIKDGLTIASEGRLQVALEPSATFSGFAGGGGLIPDNDPAGLDLTFSVSGLLGSIRRVRVSLDLNHTYVGDLTAELVAPSGIAQLVLFGRPGYRYAGFSGQAANLAGTLVFDDFALESLWDAIDGLGTSDIVPSGTYRTSTAAPFRGVTLLSNAGGCTTYLSGAFAGLSAGQANGTWTLSIVDSLGGDVGTVSSATLEIEVGPSPPNRLSGFVFPGECTLAPFDFTGTGRTSWAYVTDDSGFVRWYIKGNDGSAGGQPEETFVVGSFFTDYWVPGDYDGDGIADAASWTPDPANPPDGYKYVIRRSSRPNDLLLELPIGSSGDNPTLFGDYDGDRVTDPAVVSVPIGAGNDVTLTTLLSTAGGGVEHVLVPLQTTSDPLKSYPAEDVTGDGAGEIAFFRAGTWRVFEGLSGQEVGSPFAFGLVSDAVIAPGDFVGNGFGDFTRVFVSGADVKWQTRDGQTGTVGGEIVHGEVGIAGFSEFVAPGDFDGDGKGDYAVWRRDNSSGNVPCTPDVVGTRFIVRQSSDSTVVDFCYGEAGASPVPGANTN